MNVGGKRRLHTNEGGRQKERERESGGGERAKSIRETLTEALKTRHGLISLWQGSSTACVATLSQRFSPRCLPHMAAQHYVCACVCARVVCVSDYKAALRSIVAQLVINGAILTAAKINETRPQRATPSKDSERAAA